MCLKGFSMNGDFQTHFFLRTNDGEVLYYGGDWNFINRSGIIWSLLLAAM